LKNEASKSEWRGCFLKNEVSKSEWRGCSHHSGRFRLCEVAPMLWRKAIEVHKYPDSY
jgi:hypothetical protein